MVIASTVAGVGSPDGDLGASLAPRWQASGTRPGGSFLRDSVRKELVLHEDEPRATLPTQVGPDPLEEHGHSQVRDREELNVDECPHTPREEATHLHPTALED